MSLNSALKTGHPRGHTSYIKLLWGKPSLGSRQWKVSKLPTYLLSRKNLIEINLVLTPKTYASPSHHPEPAGFSMTWEDPASMTHLQVSNVSNLIFGLTRGCWVLFTYFWSGMCVVYVYVFCLFFEAISSTSSFLFHERHMKSYIH